MRHLIITDMHGNWDALQRVLRLVRRKRFDRTLVLGDLVGYGASPNQIVDAMNDLPGEVFVVRGNHDKVVAGIDDGESFNDVALTAALWTREKLTASNLRTVRDLPRGPRVIDGTTDDRGMVRLAICHGSPADEDTYLFSEIEARQAFKALPAAHLTFFGHTHLPSMFIQHGAGIHPYLLKGATGSIQLDPKMRYLINPGSVGQPRDRNPLAAFMIYDSEKQVVRWRRVRYPITKAQRRIEREGLPAALAERLALGV